MSRLVFRIPKNLYDAAAVNSVSCVFSLFFLIVGKIFLPCPAAFAGEFARGGARAVPVRSELLVRLSALTPDLDVRWLPESNPSLSELGEEVQAALSELKTSLGTYPGALLIEAYAPKSEAGMPARANAEARARAAAAILAPVTRLQVIRGYYGSEAFRTLEPGSEGAFIVVTLLSKQTVAVAKDVLVGSRRMRGFEPPKPGASGATPSSDPAVAEEEPEADESPQPSGPPPLPFGRGGRPGVSLATIAVVQPPTTYNGIVYRGEDASLEGVYNGKERPRSTGLAAGLEAQFPVGDWPVGVGVRIRNDQVVEGRAEFAQNVEDHEWIDQISARAFGGWIEVRALGTGLGNALAPRIGAGLDMEWSMLTIAERYHDDRVEDKATETKQSAASTLGALGARASTGLELHIGAFQAALDARAIVPIAVIARTFQRDESLPDQGLEAALDHRAQVGSEVMLTLGMVW